jgi:hypothetical protein
MTARTKAACLDAALKEPPFKAGYLDGIIRTALIQLDYSPNMARVTLERALKEIEANA